MRRPDIDEASRSLPVLFGSQFYIGVMLITLGPVLDSILKDLGLSLAQGGLLSLAFYAGRVTGMLLLNFALARIPLKAVMVGCAGVMAVGSAVAGLLSFDLGSLMAALYVTGVGGVIPNAVSGVWVASHVKRGLERAMLLISAFFALGVVVAPLLIGAFLESGVSWRWVFVGEAALSAMVAVALGVLPFADVKGRQNLNLARLRGVAAGRGHLLGVMLAAIFLYVATEGMLGVWLPKHQVEAFGAGPTVAALSVTLFWAGITVGRYLAVPLTRRFSPARLLAGFAALEAVFIVATTLMPGLLWSEVFAFLAGLGASACWPLVACYTPRFPGWYSGVVYSLMMLAGTAAYSVFSYAVGPAAEAVGISLALALAAVPAAAVVGLAFALERAAREGTPVSPAQSAPGQATIY
jgi:fucose permease